MEQLRRVAARLAGYEVVVMLGAVALGMVLTRLLFVAPAVALGFGLLRWFGAGSPRQRTPVDAPALLLALLAAAGLWWTPVPDLTQTQVLRLLGGMALAQALVNWTAAWERRRWLLLLSLLMLWGLGLFALIGVEWGGSAQFGAFFRRVYAALPVLVTDAANPNVLAGSLVLLAPLAGGLLLFAWPAARWPERLLAAGGVLMAIVLAVLGQSVGALLGLGAALAVLAALRWRWGWSAALAGLAVMAWLAWQSGLPLPGSAAGVEAGIPAGLETRVEIWSRAIYIMQDFPLTGAGTGSYGWMVDHLYPLFLLPLVKAPHAHNLFLQLGVDVGLPGLAAWLAIWLGTSAAAWQTWRAGQRTADAWRLAWGAGLLACNLALAAHGLVDAVTWGMVRPAPLVWFIWGLILVGRQAAAPADGAQAG